MQTQIRLDQLAASVNSTWDDTLSEWFTDVTEPIGAIEWI